MAEPEQESGTPASDENNAKMEESDLNASASEMTVDQTSTVLSSLSLEESQGTVLSSLSLEEEIEGDGEEEKGGEERGGSEEVNQRNPGAEEEEWQDILGNGLLMKKILRKGEGISTRPAPQCRVRVRSRGFLECGDVVDKHSGYWFTVGDGDVVQAWDIAVTLMERDELCRVKTAPRFAYGANGKGSTIPSDATITYELELLEVLEPVEFGSLDEEEVVKIVERKKTRGNELYQGREYSGAIKSYQRNAPGPQGHLVLIDQTHWNRMTWCGLQAITSYLDEKPTISNVPSTLLEMQIRCLNNIAAAQLKIKQYREALSACEKVLQKDADNVKALYRAGRVLAHIGELDDAVSKLKKALSLSPQDTTIQTELKRTIKKREQSLKEEKKMYRRMLDPTPALPHAQKSSSHKDAWGPWPYMFIAGTTAVIAIGMAYFFTQRH